MYQWFVYDKFSEGWFSSTQTFFETTHNTMNFDAWWSFCFSSLVGGSKNENQIYLCSFSYFRCLDSYIIDPSLAKLLILLFFVEVVFWSFTLTSLLTNIWSSDLQTETIDLTEQSAKSDRAQRLFRRSNLDKSSHQLIDSDGLPYVGQVTEYFFSYFFGESSCTWTNMIIWLQRINPNEPYCSIYNEITSQTTSMKLKGSEPVVVDYVAVDVKNKAHLQKVSNSSIYLTIKRYISVLLLGF